MLKPDVAGRRSRAFSRRSPTWHFGAAAVLAGALCATGALPAMAQPFPSRPARIVVPFPPGGPLDVVGRGIAQKLSET